MDNMAAYAQFGYSYPSASQLLVSGQTTTTAASSASPLSGSMSPGGSAASGGPGALSPGGGAGGSSNQGPPGSSTTGLGPGSAGLGPGSGPGGPLTSSASSASQCCESGRPIVTDPVTGQSVCSCQYDSARLALSQYPRGVGVYGTPYPSTEQNPYPSIGVDSGFYSSLSNPYGLKDGSSSAEMSAWTSAGLQPTTGYYPYDPALAAYGYGAGYDLAARRKNATRESTATLKAWLNEHKKNPYPTKGEKIMLAIITKMTLTQVSTWFANARRRLKKENKMTWEPKNKTDDDDDAILSDSDDKDKDDMLDDKRDETDIHGRVKAERGNLDDDDLTDDERKDNLHHMHHMLGGGNYNLKPEMKTSDCGVPLPASKPKIWSLADTAACKTPPPPPPVSNPHHLQHHPHHLQQHHQQQQHHLQQQQQHHHHWLTGGGNTNNGFALPSSAARYAGAASSGFLPSHCQQGFPDVQTDTPPQTPPNMKLPSVAGNLVSVPGGGPPPGQCQPSTGYGPPPSAFLAGAGGFGRPSSLQQQSQQQQHQMGIVQSHQQDNTAFKPFYKSTSQAMSGGFVAPV